MSSRLALALVAVYLLLLLPIAASAPVSQAGTAHLSLAQSISTEAASLPAQAAFRVICNSVVSDAINCSDADLVAAVNAARKEVGQPPIDVVDTALTGIARAHNDEMARCAASWGWGSTCVAHQVPGGPDFPTRLGRAGYGTGGEIIGHAYDNAGATVDAWLNSPTHRYVLLDATYNRIGCAEDRYSNTAEGWLYTCVFAYSPLTPTPLPNNTPVVFPTRTPSPHSTPVPNPTVDPRGPLPSGYVMRIFVYDAGFDRSTCYMAGVNCFREYRLFYDNINQFYPNPWDISDYFFYRFCPNPITGNVGNYCEWPKSK